MVNISQKVYQIIHTTQKYCFSDNQFRKSYFLINAHSSLVKISYKKHVVFTKKQNN